MSAGLEVEALAEPIVRLLASFGSGSTDAAAAALRESSGVVDGAHEAGRSGINGMYTAWNGRGGDAAMDKALQVQTGAATVSDRGEAMAAVVDRAGAEVAAGQREVAEILRSFLAKVDAVSAAGFSPAALALIVGTAIDHVGQALRIVQRVRAELEAETISMSELATPPKTPAPAILAPEATSAAAVEPAASGSAVVPASAGSALGGGQQVASTVVSSGGKVLESGASMLSGLSTTAASVGDSPPTSTDRSHRSTPETRPSGTRVKLTLPDGSTVEAPNQQAADAVRSALSAVGTPYVWGGTTPGAGLDCSGLTQWAYAQAGVPLPRLAQEQGYGHQQVSPGDLMPGDLAVWDGHVAMVIGNGQLVEAGDPVQTGPIRTENMGMGFLGFYRPTA
ncbi:hydrolase [Nocardia sp. SYP-A9097]|uniref:bifunctional WXG100 family type VII secretion target/C40 family peptidase n=1 Tax=Nocardia sp. SYP-A9097 TaxID=2663237 RepID=UPI00132B162D|nr:NlpC/P60 family protein [Nocardia sp. SYP-A9097]MRH88823.1 hydrolase [Nocardia sp. SYP-A9097]